MALYINAIARERSQSRCSIPRPARDLPLVQFARTYSLSNSPIWTSLLRLNATEALRRLDHQAAREFSIPQRLSITKIIAAGTEMRDVYENYTEISLKSRNARSGVAIPFFESNGAIILRTFLWPLPLTGNRRRSNRTMRRMRNRTPTSRR